MNFVLQAPPRKRKKSTKSYNGDKDTSYTSSPWLLRSHPNVAVKTLPPRTRKKNYKFYDDEETLYAPSTKSPQKQPQVTATAPPPRTRKKNTKFHNHDDEETSYTPSTKSPWKQPRVAATATPPSKKQKKNTKLYSDDVIISYMPSTKSPWKHPQVTATAAPPRKRKKNTKSYNDEEDTSYTPAPWLLRYQPNVTVKTLPPRKRKKTKFYNDDEDTSYTPSTRSPWKQPQVAASALPPRILNENTMIYDDIEETSYTPSTTSPRKQPRVAASALGQSFSPEVKRAGQEIGVQLRNLLNLSKPHKWLCYEWFYSNLDIPLLLEENDFCNCLKEIFPQLKTRCLRRVEWCKIRRLLGKPRRCSSAFFREEREALEIRRNKIRLLQKRKVSELQGFKELPDEIPEHLVIGTKVTARLRRPQEGLFTGTVDDFNTVRNSYRISFDSPELGTRSIPDYEVLSNEHQETVPLSAFQQCYRTGSANMFSPPKFIPSHGSINPELTKNMKPCSVVLNYIKVEADGTGGEDSERYINVMNKEVDKEEGEINVTDTNKEVSSDKKESGMAITETKGSHASRSPVGSPPHSGSGSPHSAHYGSPQGSPQNAEHMSPAGSGSPVHSGSGSPTRSRSGSPKSTRSESRSPSRSRSGSPAGSHRCRSGSPAGSHRSRSGSPAGSHRSRSGSPAGSHRSRSGSPAGSHRSRSGSPVGSHRSGSGSPTRSRSRSGSPKSRSRSQTPAGSRSGSGSPARSGSGSPRRSRSRSGTPKRSRSGSGSPRSRSRSRSGSPSGRRSRSEGSHASRSPVGSPPHSGSGSPHSAHSGSPQGSPQNAEHMSPAGSGSPVHSGSGSPTRSRSGSPKSTRSESRSPSRSRSGSPAGSHRSRSGSPAGSHRSRSGSPAGSHRSRSGSPAGSHRSRSGSPVGSHRSGSGSPTRSRSRSGSPKSRSRSQTPAGSRSGSGSPARSGSGSPRRSRSRSGTPQRSRSGSGSPRSRSRSRSGNPSGRRSRSEGERSEDLSALITSGVVDDLKQLILKIDSNCSQERMATGIVSSLKQILSGIGKNETGKKATKRPCPFCNKFFVRLTKHIANKHGEEDIVKKAMKLPKDLRVKRFGYMKNEGIRQYNMEILKGDFSPSDLLKARKSKDQNKECVICSGCGKFLVKDNMLKHEKMCSALSSDDTVEGISPAVFSAPAAVEMDNTESGSDDDECEDEDISDTEKAISPKTRSNSAKAKLHAGLVKNGGHRTKKDKKANNVGDVPVAAETKTSSFAVNFMKKRRVSEILNSAQEEKVVEDVCVPAKPSEDNAESSSDVGKKCLKRPCPYCGEFFCRLTKHLKRRHRLEDKVKKAIKLPKNLRDKQFESLRIEGIINHNMEILKGKFSPSDLIKNRKPKVQNKECVICSGCGKFLMKDNMYKHRKTCSAISSDGSYVEGISPYVLSAVDSNFSDSHKTSVLERFHRNDVGKQIQEDDWIKMFGYLHFQGTERSINRIEKRKYIMARMRRLAKLFIIFKKVTAGKDVDTSSSVLMFCRENIEYLLKAVGIMTAADDEGQTIRRKFNILMKSSINDVCRQLEEYYLAKLTKEDDLRKEELKNFTSLLNRKWTKYFSAAEEEDLSEENSDSELNEPEKSPQSFIQHSEPEKSPQSCIQHSEPEKSPQSCIQDSEPEKSPQSFIQHSEPEKSPQSCIQHNSKIAELSESLNASSIQHYIATELSTGEEVPNDEGQLMIKHFGQPEIMNKNVNQSPRGVREIMCVDAHLSSLDNTKGPGKRTSKGAFTQKSKGNETEKI